MRDSSTRCQSCDVSHNSDTWFIFPSMALGSIVALAIVVYRYRLRLTKWLRTRHYWCNDVVDRLSNVWVTLQIMVLLNGEAPASDASPGTRAERKMGASSTFTLGEASVAFSQRRWRQSPCRP